MQNINHKIGLACIFNFIHIVRDIILLQFSDLFEKKTLAYVNMYLLLLTQLYRLQELYVSSGISFVLCSQLGILTIETAWMTTQRLCKP